MDQRSQTRRQVIRTAVSLAGVFLVLHLAQRSDVLSELTRPFTIGLLRLFGLPVSQGDDALLVGRLAIPWSRDCAGLNVLGILWAMTLWANRSEPRTGRYALRLLLAVPAAFVANVARILTLIGYRQVLYPAVESPQLHYFIGFLWLVPVVWFFCPRGERSVSRYVTETLHLAAALSLLAPLISAPGGSFVALGTLVLLANSRFDLGGAGRIGFRLAVWLVAALLIAGTRMESLWLPWLIACPAFTSLRAAGSLSGAVLLLGTIPLVAMHSAAQWGMLCAAGFVLWQWRQTSTPVVADGRAMALKVPALRIAWPGVVAVALLIPFAASPVNALFARRHAPPAATMPLDLGANAYRVRLLGQAPDLDLVWYEPTGEGRHHTLEVCMRYRGVTVQPAAVPDVKTDGQRWMREFFLQPGGQVLTYGDYLRKTFLPFSPAGVHVIASSPVEAMSAESFAESTGRLARELSRMLEQERLIQLRHAGPAFAVNP